MEPCRKAADEWKALSLLELRIAVGVVIGATTGSGCDGDRDWRLELELEVRLGGDLGLLTACDGIDACPCAAAGQRADGRAFTAAGERTDDCAECRTAAGLFCGVLAAPQPVSL